MPVIRNKTADDIISLAEKYQQMGIKETLAYMISMCTEEELIELLADGVEVGKARFCIRLAHNDIVNE